MEKAFATFQIEDEEQGGISYEDTMEDLGDINTMWCLRVIDGSPWTFGRFHLVMDRLRDGDDPKTVEIQNLWVQLHGMRPGFMSQHVATDIGNYVGRYIDGDPNNFVGVWRKYLRIRVSLPLDIPIKQRMKLKKSETDWCWVTFKYESIPTFCFIYGLIGHEERFCERIFEGPMESIEKPYGAWLRAEPKTKNTHNRGPPLIMNALAWNCQGLGSPGKIQFLQIITRSEKLDFVFLCKTISSYEKMDKFCHKLGYEGLIAVEPRGKSGGITMFWKNAEKLNLLSMSRSHIDVVVKKLNLFSWRLTGIYGEPERAQRHKTWELLRNLSRDANLPWCLFGDFNNVKSQVDKKGGHPYHNHLVEGFNACLHDTELQDLDIIGHQYIWERGRNTNHWIEIRLDRVLANPQWRRLFEMSKVYNLEGSPSNHSPLLLIPEEQVKGNKRHKFRFENAWLTEPVCFQIIKDKWVGEEDSNVMRSVKSCAEGLDVWGKEITSCFSKRIRDCKLRLKSLRGKRYPSSVAEYDKVKQQLFLVLDQKEIFWRKRLFTEEYLSVEEILRRIPQSVSDQKNNMFLERVFEDEVKMVIFNMHPDKAPGPEGMTPAFFQKNWSVIGRDVVEIVRQFFETGNLIDNINMTNIVLIPKKKNPSKLTELRPISLCNVVMKIITKVLANRLKKVLDSIISDSQSAFLPGRLISDNIMISFEVMHYLKRKKFGKEGYMALKLDMSKAYDRIEWKFLKEVLLMMGFNDWWTHLILRYVSTIEYNIFHGDFEIGLIRPSRGLRQGDPLPPYLFIIYAEGLLTLIKHYETQGWLHGASICRRAPRISHILFADDSYMFSKADSGDTSKVLEMLTVYEKASGKHEASDNSKYLGLPNILGRNKSVIFGYLRDKVTTCIQGWMEKNVSRPSKELLIKTVAQTLPTYAMSVFLLPLELTRDMEKVMAQFF
ncbi:uncharacterized protein LOC141660391 [Apium graveolens]|uniref:uncharacterized protein LOC141660391 n=1 Tax=Apium graveolens TaxID=4045 RepID=UPI003D7C03C5